MTSSVHGICSMYRNGQGQIHLVGFIRLKPTIHRCPTPPNLKSNLRLPGCHSCAVRACTKEEKALSRAREVRTKACGLAEAVKPDPTHIHLHPPPPPVPHYSPTRPQPHVPCCSHSIIPQSIPHYPTPIGQILSEVKRTVHLTLRHHVAAGSWASRSPEEEEGSREPGGDLGIRAWVCRTWHHCMRKGPRGD